MQTDILNDINSYLNHIDSRIKYKHDLVAAAFERTLSDINYHFPNLSAEETVKRINSNNNESAIFLFRLGNLYFDMGDENKIICIHGLLRSTCACEIYFSNKIDTGFYIVHSVGTVIGSRNVIGKGFVVYQNCTIGHERDNEDGATIGDQVTMLPNSSIIGNVTVGNNIVIGAYTLVKTNLPGDSVVAGIPGKVIKTGATENNRRLRPNLL